MYSSHRLVSYEEVGDEIHLTFQDGSSAICDLLIGVDGIKSVVPVDYRPHRHLILMVRKLSFDEIVDLIRLLQYVGKLKV